MASSRPVESRSGHEGGGGDQTGVGDRVVALVRLERIVYCEPGDVLPLGDTGVKARVLGPPRFKDRAGTSLNNDKNKPLVYLLKTATRCTPTSSSA